MKFVRTWKTTSGSNQYLNVRNIARFVNPVVEGQAVGYADAFDAEGNKLGRIDADEAEFLARPRPTFIPDHTGSAFLVYWDFDTEVRKERWPVIGWRIEPHCENEQGGALAVTCTDLVDGDNCWWMIEIWSGGKPSLWSRPNHWDEIDLKTAEGHFDEWLAARRKNLSP